jgi:hypothetical protein
MTTAIMELDIDATPEIQYSAVAYRVVSDDVTLGDLYEDSHSCYSEEESPDETQLYPSLGSSPGARAARARSR